ncbi:MAG: 4Fe-4S binding protein, partial [Erysipelotrichaceae bacterium]|nr:4Fe-4S binding protein [Erysipelotrichaceae bacterium]
MIKFDTKVQYLKYQVLKEVARHAHNGDLMEHVLDIPKDIVSGDVPTMRCCVYKERAILAERVKMAINTDRSKNNVIQTIDIACDECPVGGYEVTASCRGCIAHRCAEACPRQAITFDSQQKAHIDKSKCVECGLCAKVCPYNAIVNYQRPCEKACKVNAITMDDNKKAVINDDKCIACGACVYQCPFGAITDRS